MDLAGRLGLGPVVPLAFRTAGRTPRRGHASALPLVVTAGYVGSIVGPLLVGFIAFTMLTTWSKGRTLMRKHMAEASLPLDIFAKSEIKSDTVKHTMDAEEILISASKKIELSCGFSMCASMAASDSSLTKSPFQYHCSPVGRRRTPRQPTPSSERWTS